MPIKTYGRTELAQLYFPAIGSESAWRKLKDIMQAEPALQSLLSSGRRTFLPGETRLIFDHLGTPSAI